MDSIVHLLIHLCDDLIVYVQIGPVDSHRDGSLSWAARGTHLAFGLCIAFHIELGLQLKVFILSLDTYKMQ